MQSKNTSIFQQIKALDLEIATTVSYVKQYLSQSKKTLMQYAAESPYCCASEGFTTQKALACPIGVTYLSTFLDREHCSENLLAYFEVKSLRDYVLHMTDTCSQTLCGQVNKRCQRLLDKYIVSGSTLEVNLSATVQQNIQRVLKEAISKYKDSQVLGKDYLKLVDTCLDQTETELLHNLNDPFQRFLHSELFFELAALLLSGKVSLLSLREKLVNTNKEDGAILNNTLTWDPRVTPKHPLTVVENVLNTLNNVLKHPSAWHVVDDKVQLNYPAFKIDLVPMYFAFRECTAELMVVDMSLLANDDQKQAFFLNLYNLMTIHAAIESDGIPQCPISLTQWSRRMTYSVGGISLSLDQVRYGLLKHNQKHFIFGKRIGAYDKERMGLMVQRDSPLVDFGMISPSSKHSPVLRVFNAAHVQDQLASAARVYLEKHAKVSQDKTHVILPGFLKENVKLFSSKNRVAQLLHAHNLPVRFSFTKDAECTSLSHIFEATPQDVQVSIKSNSEKLVTKGKSAKAKIKAIACKVAHFAKSIFHKRPTALSV